MRKRLLISTVLSLFCTAFFVSCAPLVDSSASSESENSSSSEQADIIETTVGSKAFFQCAALTTVEISSTVIEIGDFSFQYADGLSKFFIPKSVENIGGYALGGIGYDEGNGYQSTWVYVEAESTGLLWDGF